MSSLHGPAGHSVLPAPLCAQQPGGSSHPGAQSCYGVLAAAPPSSSRSWWVGSRTLITRPFWGPALSRGSPGAPTQVPSVYLFEVTNDSPVPREIPWVLGALSGTRTRPKLRRITADSSACSADHGMKIGPTCHLWWFPLRHARANTDK